MRHGCRSVRKSELIRMRRKTLLNCKGRLAFNPQEASADTLNENGKRVTGLCFVQIAGMKSRMMPGSAIPAEEKPEAVY